jgi:hypothetical protein
VAPTATGGRPAGVGLVVALVLAVVGIAVGRADGAATRATAAREYGCWAYAAAMLDAGAPPAVAARMAFVVAPRESGCQMARVNDADDHSCSWVGLNGKGRLWATWIDWCGVDVRAPAPDRR